MAEVGELQSHRKWQMCDLALFKCSQAFMEASKDALIFTLGKLCKLYTKLYTKYDLNNVNYIGK